MIRKPFPRFFIHQQLLIIILFLFSVKLSAQQNLTVAQYIERYKDIAMEEMRKHGIPASIKLGQGILESGFGNSDLARVGNNHFGIKCHGWQGRTFLKDDDHANECFRAYDDPHQSFRDHSEFLLTRPRYAFLFELEATDYKGWARGLRQAGYATNPRYPDLLIGVIERNGLHEFDQIVIKGGEMMLPQRPIVQIEPRQAEEFPNVTAGRQIRENNRIRYVIARSGDTPETIARETGIWAWEVTRYNELGKNGALKEGQLVYLQPKRKNANQHWHIVQEGETMYDISQKFGVKQKILYRRNSIHPDTLLQPGQRIKLRWDARK